MKKHLVVIYPALVILSLLILFWNQQEKPNDENIDKILNRLTKVEFFQEATRVRDNVVGFKQVYASLANNTERSKNCFENTDLLAEWSEDIERIGTDYKDYMESNHDAKSYFESIDKVYQGIVAECGELVKKQ